MLIENRRILKEKNPAIIETLLKSEPDDQVLVVQSKLGSPTLKIKFDGRDSFLHSKYNPQKEAQSLINQYSDIGEYQHVFFYGVGMGYHIQAMMKQYPHLNFSIYEPNSTIMKHYLEHQCLDKLPLDKLIKIYVESSSDDVALHLADFSIKLHEKVLLIALPSYQRIYKQSFERFLVEFKNIIKDTRTYFYISKRFQKHWTLNSMRNLAEVVATANILDKRRYFSNKPTIIVSAGPSLEEEYENLRYIKEHGLAYIFSVGSAINALLEQNIYPDAACTYDPLPHNYKVFEKVNDRGITTIPLIFGSSVGSKTLNFYKGPKLHMITTQDAVSPYYLRHSVQESIELVGDASSIAIVTLELLEKLGCHQVVLVGQNLGYRNDQFYAQGISYQYKKKSRTTQLRQEEREKAIITKDVYGRDMYTSVSFELMKRDMEATIARLSGVEVINTTKGGAHIKGTSFITLDEVMGTRLLDRVVDPLWMEENISPYDIDYVHNQASAMHGELERFEQLFCRLERTLQYLERNLLMKHYGKTEKELSKFEEHLQSMQRNNFYNTFVKPRFKIEYEMLFRNMDLVKDELDLLVKARKVYSIFSKYLQQCQLGMEELKEEYQAFNDKIMKSELI